MAEFPLSKALWQALWERLYHSEIYPWCVSCLKAIGAEIRFGEYQITEPRSQWSRRKPCLYCLDCKTCQPFADQLIPSFCRTCYSNEKSICLANGHQLHQNTISVSSDCFIAKNPEDERRCDAFHCGKKISGLYFREFHIKKTLHLAYFILRLLCL